MEVVNTNCHKIFDKFLQMKAMMGGTAVTER